MPKRTLTEKEIAELQKRRHESLMSTPVFRNIAGTARNINMQPQNVAAVAQMIQNNPSLNPGINSGILNSAPVNQGGLIADVDTGATTPVIQPRNQQQPSNIFGDVLGTVFPGIDQNNKQLINAAILRGSLELLKPRQPGEGLASQFGRAIDAGQKVGTDLQKQELENLVAGIGLQKTIAETQKLEKESKGGKPIKPTVEQSRIYKSSITSLIKMDKDFAADINTIQQKSGDWGGLNDETSDLLSLAAIDLVNRGDYADPIKALKEVAKRQATGQPLTNNQTTQPGVDKFADRNIKIKQ